MECQPLTEEPGGEWGGGENWAMTQPRGQNCFLFSVARGVSEGEGSSVIKE